MPHVITRKAKPPRILIISPIFAPTADSEAFCGGKMALGLLKRHCEVAVITMSPFNEYMRRKDMSEYWDLLKSYIYEACPIPKTNKLSAILRALKYRTVADTRWISSVISQAQLLHVTNRFDVVYSRSLPMCAHMAGYSVSRFLGIPWIANTNDPWDWHLFPHLKKKTSVIMEVNSNQWLRRTVSNADLITYPSDRLWKFHETLSGIPHRAEVLAHIGYGQQGQPDPEVFTIVHAGVLNFGWGLFRSPHPFLQALKIVQSIIPEADQKFRVLFIGSEDSHMRDLVRDYELTNIVKCTGRVSYEESLQYISSAHVCLLLEMEMKEGIYLPSKLADYIASGKPVIAVSPKTGVVDDLSRHGGICRVDSGDPKAISEIIVKHYTAYKFKHLESYAPPKDLKMKFDEENIISVFLDFVGRVLRQGRFAETKHSQAEYPRDEFYDRKSEMSLNNLDRD